MVLLMQASAEAAQAAATAAQDEAALANEKASQHPCIPASLLCLLVPSCASLHSVVPGPQGCLAGPQGCLAGTVRAILYSSSSSNTALPWCIAMVGILPLHCHSALPWCIAMVDRQGQQI